MSNLLEKLRRVKFDDIKEIWKLPVSLLIAPIYRLKHKDLWIVCEDENEARDNGYWFFKYVRENHPEQECVYAIHKSSFDYKKVRNLGRTVEFGSLKHWIMYLASTKKISSQKAGNPNAAIFYFLEVYQIIKNKRIFLQHGVIINDLKWLYYDVTKMRRFISGAYPEYIFIRDNFGYPLSAIKYTGLCRYDGLHDDYKVKRQVLIMPTWREWIADEDYRLKKFEGTTDIPKTNYFRNWTGFICSKRLKEFSEQYNVRFVFFPHREMQKYMEFFPESNEYLSVLSGKDIDIQKLLKESALMITDYSSVFTDFVYMKKPIVFFQFDYELFRKAQYEEGYFDYRNNPFAKSFNDANDVFNEIEKIINKDFIVDSTFLDAHKKFFRLYDSENCKRVYEVVKKA